MVLQNRKPTPRRSLGRTRQQCTEPALARQDNNILLSVRQLVESGLEQSHETKFKKDAIDATKKYAFDLNVPTGKRSRLGIKLTRKQTVEETRLTIRRIDAHDRPYAVCERQQKADDDGIHRLYCTLLGPILCPCCMQVADQAEFTQKQDAFYPQIDVGTRYIVAGGKLTKRKMAASSKGVFISPFQRQVDLNALEGVVTDEDIHRRLRAKSDLQLQLAVN